MTDQKIDQKRPVQCDGLTRSLARCRRQAIRHIPAGAFVGPLDLCRTHYDAHLAESAAFNRRNG